MSRLQTLVPSGSLLFRIQEAAEYFQVHESTIYRLMKNRALKPVRIGRSTRIPLAELIRIYGNQHASTMVPDAVNAPPEAAAQQPSLFAEGEMPVVASRPRRGRKAKAEK